jgi:hypothetical protein
MLADDIQVLWGRERICCAEAVKTELYVGGYHSSNSEHVRPSSPAEIYRRFGEICCLHFRGRRADNEGGGMFS